ncbi:MAG: hypothetical protein WBB10_27655 [Rhodococcus qingshengii]
MPPTHPSQADAAAAYRTLIAHETEPKEQDFYRTRLQRLEQATEPECEFDCCSRIAAAGVGIYCPQCSAKCADTDLTTQLAKAIRAAWVDRLDWDELAQGALEFLTSADRLIPAGGMALTAEQASWVQALSQADPWWDEEHLTEVQAHVRALFPATEPAEPATQSAGGDCFDVCEGHPTPAEPAEEETKAEDYCCHPMCRHTNWGGSNRKHTRGSDCPIVPKPTSSPVAPAPTETGPEGTAAELREFAQNLITDIENRAPWTADQIAEHIEENFQ